jgi:hypothetical protein
MTRLQRRVLPLAGVLAILLALPASAIAVNHKRCWAPGTSTVAATKDVRVYYRGELENHARYACATRTGRRWRLGVYTTASYGPGVINVQIGGRFVGFEYVSCSDSCENADVRVFDTRTGRLHRSPKVRAGFDGISGLVVLKTGRLAYIARYYPAQLEVHLFDGSADRVIDSGPGIAGGSLAVAGTTLYWIRDGAPQAFQT